MSRSRRCIGLDVDLAEELKNISKLRGMSIVNYLRRLLDEVIELEKHGYYAPDIIYEKRIELILSKLGFIYVPAELIEQNVKLDNAEIVGEKIGKALLELGIDIGEFIERFALRNDIAIIQKGSVILVPTTGVKDLIRHVIIGIAKAAGLSISTSGSTIIIKVKP